MSQKSSTHNIFHSRSAQSCVRAGHPLVLAFASLLLSVGLFSMVHTAQAEDIDTNPTPDALQQQVERTAAALEEAVAAVEAADAALEENQSKIDELEKLIPIQQKKSDAAARELYKFEQQRIGIIDLVLSADSFYDLMTNLDYINRITATNVAEINRLREMRAELNATQEELETAKLEADERAVEAERALTAAQEARLEAQRRAEEAARQAAEAAAAARIASAPAQAEEGTTSNQAVVETAVVQSTGDSADWTSDEASFVNSWAGRIDAYLGGSPLAGQGRTFAQAAWNYGVDPRWSPAIAYTESSLGAYCFLPHNAWGWGSSSWGSWEEAIDAHVRGLARGYGYTISWDAAYKYCPPNANHWYNVTLSQMNMI